MGGNGAGASAGRTSPAIWAAAPNAGFDAWAQGFASRAIARGLPAGVVSRAMTSAGYIPEVVVRDRNQTEVKRSLEDYLSIAASDQRVAMGRSALAQQNTE
jgi:membrane-bound lytic murein transglycosylase B